MDRRGVSPVVAAVLLIAITVIAVSVVALFVTKIAAPVEFPRASLKITLKAATDEVTIEHISGDALKQDELVLWIGVNKRDPLGTGSLVAGKIITVPSPTVLDSGNIYAVRIMHSPSKATIYDRRIVAK